MFISEEEDEEEEEEDRQCNLCFPITTVSKWPSQHAWHSNPNCRLSPTLWHGRCGHIFGQLLAAQFGQAWPAQFGHQSACCLTFQEPTFLQTKIALSQFSQLTHGFLKTFKETYLYRSGGQPNNKHNFSLFLAWRSCQNFQP